MTSRPLAQSLVGTVAAIGLSLNVAAAEPGWPDRVRNKICSQTHAGIMNQRRLCRKS